ncbi:sigma-70 family RNA polymerase sigma factor [Desulfobacterales bacterium HSG2]|nr:sigma-70 family RNA polymerase sigma factor [Desulfobacterales bacterium HSG2]
MDENIKNSKLIKAAQKGNKAAFDQLVLKYKDSVFNLCYCLLGDYRGAEESAQKVFINMYRGLGKFGFKAKFSVWLYRIAVNICKNRLEKQPGTPKMNSPDDAELSAPSKPPEKKERAELIRQEISALPRDKKTVILLRDIERLSYREIAVITGLKLGAVKSNLSEARETLKKELRRKNVI